MKRFLIILWTLILIPLLASGVGATLIDFEGLAASDVMGGNQIPIPGSVLTNDFSGSGVLFGKAGVSLGVAVVTDSLAPSSGVNSIAGLDASGNIPGSSVGGAAVGDIYFSFLGVTDFVKFSIGDAGGDVDIFDIRAYDLADALIYDVHFTNTSRFFTQIAVADIHRVEVDFTGDYGYSLDDLEFNAPVGIPEPATMLLLGTGLVGLVGFRRKLKA